jgi:hypothetical protein
MRHVCWAVPLALLAFLAAATDARAQHYPRSTYQTGYYHEFRNYYGQPEASPSDVPVTPMDSVLAPPPGPTGGAHHGGNGYLHQSCDPVCAPTCGGCNGCDCQDDGDEVIHLFPEIQLPGGHRCGCGDPPVISVGGWMSGGITRNADGNRSGLGNFPVPYNYVSDGPILNQLWIYAEKVVDTGGAGADWGFRVDYLFGTDAPFTQSFGDQGWDYGWNSSRDYGSAIPQLFVDLGYNNWTLRLGHFYTIIGYEVVPAIGNFFYSHALTQNFGEPFTHTGGLLRYSPDDAWTFFGGYVFGWDSGFENLNDAHTFLGGVTYTWEEIGSLAWAVNTGDFGDGSAFPGAATGDIYMNSLVGIVNFTNDIQYVIQHDHGVNNNVPGGPGAEWYGIVQYLFINLTDAVRFGARFEWFDDSDGARIGAHPNANPAAVALGNTEGDYYNATLGLNIRPHANFVLRPEMRWDWFKGSAPPGARPYDNGTENNLFTVGIDGVLQY